MDFFRNIRIPPTSNESHSPTSPHLHCENAYNDEAGDPARDIEESKHGGSPDLRADVCYLDDGSIEASRPDEVVFLRQRSPAWQRLLGALSVSVRKTPRRLRKTKQAVWLGTPTVCGERLARQPRILRSLIYLTLLCLMLL